MYGPTVGDRVRLGDTSLIAEVEKDLTVHGDEAKFGGGKSTFWAVLTFAAERIVKRRPKQLEEGAL